MTIKTLLTSLFLGFLLSPLACATPVVKPPTFVEAPKELPKPLPPAVIAVPYPQPVPGQLKPMPPAAPSKEAISKARAKAHSPHQVIDEANRLSAQFPTKEGYFNAIQTYDYMPGSLYKVYSAPNHLTMVSFAPGEEVYEYAAGDTIRWVVGESYSGDASTRRTHLFLQPNQKNLHTTMIVTTSLGVYQFELHSYQHAFMAGVQFRHPRAMIMALQNRARIKTSSSSHSSLPASSSPKGLGLSVPLESLEDRYTLVVEDRDDVPRWMPRRVFHDGRRTYIEFPRHLGKSEQPALFLLSKRKTPRIVQYTQEGRYMVIPGVVKHAMLRLGQKGEEEQVGIELKEEAGR